MAKPVCLFPKRKACAAFNSEMLSSLPSKVHTFVCTDEVDETASTRKWSKNAADQLEKLNNGCNRTAGLEAKLELAVGARVMLRRNIDTKAGLVNGVIGNVYSVSSSCVTVQVSLLLRILLWKNLAKSLALTMDRGDLRTPPQSGSILLTCSGNGTPVPPLAHSLNNSVCSYVCQLGKWHQYGPTSVEAHCNVLPKSMYIRHTVNHFDVVSSV